MDFYDRVGIVGLGSRLRRLSESITGDSTEIYKLQGIKFEPKWWPVFYVLYKDGPCSVKEIAEKVGHSHPSVSQTTKGMIKKGIVKAEKDETDGRITLLSLTQQGLDLIPDLEELYIDVRKAVDELLQETYHDIWKALQDLEYALAQKDLLSRVKTARKERESTYVKIIDYAPQHRIYFKDLNEEWIKKYFMLEPTDSKVLENPEDYILNPGGHILMATYKEEVVGTCALIKMDDGSYELAKMAVSPAAQGKKIGWLLAQGLIKKARSTGAKRIYLESNTKLTPAINLYHKLGFKKVVGPPSPYARANIQMELML